MKLISQKDQILLCGSQYFGLEWIVDIIGDSRFISISKVSPTFTVMSESRIPYDTAEKNSHTVKAMYVLVEIIITQVSLHSVLPCM